MKAITRQLWLCLTLVTVLSSVGATEVFAYHGAIATVVFGQTAPATEAERRQAAEQWLKLARQSLQDGKLEEAGKYLERAEKLNVSFGGSTSRYGETPEKIRRDLATARAGNATTAVAPDAKGTAQSYLEKGRAALAQGAVNDAINWRQKAMALNVSYGPGEFSPAQLGRELQQAGVDPNRLAPPEVSATGRPARLPPIESARPLAGSGVANNAAPPVLDARQQQAKAAALRLSSEAQAALDRGDLANAQRFSQQAEALQVPDWAFGDGEMRPWEVALRVQATATRRAGVQPANNVEALPGRYPVAQGVYDPQQDRSRNMLVNVQEPTPANANPQGGEGSPGVQLYQQGIGALERQDRAAALEAFREAWKHERTLPPEIRRELRDKLSLLNQAQPLPTADGQAPSPLEEVASSQHLLYQKLYREISVEEQNAKRLSANDPKKALETMQQLRTRVTDAELDAPAKKQLLTFVDRNINELQQYIDQNRSEIDLNERNKRILDEVEGRQTKKLETDDKIAELVEEYNRLTDEERFAEAEVKAKQVRALDPDNPIARTLALNSRMRTRLAEQDAIRDAKEEGFYNALTSVDESAIPEDDRQVMKFAKGWKDLSQGRLQRQREGMRRMSPRELEIKAALSKPVDVRFTDRPLSEVVETLGSVAGINIHLDPAGLAAEGITPSTPITLNFANPIMLKSVLTLILEPLRLGYDIRSEVLIITSEQAKDSNVYTVTYYVADLVMPIPNFVPGYDSGLASAIREAHQALGYGGALMQPVSTAPLAMSPDALNRPVTSNQSILAQYGMTATGQSGTRPTTVSGSMPGHMGGAAMADFDTLIDLIQQTIAPDSWADAGGSGAIESFPTNLSLVISQTQDVHDQITDLLEQLRRLQDLQVAIEVKFLRLSDNFFERIGVDFDVKVDDNVTARRRDDQGPSQAIGLSQAGTVTADQDIPFLSGVGPGSGPFSVTTPQFGGFDANSTALNFGVAILSDIETYFLLTASTGDQRANVMQAPKVTLFNGQTANVQDNTQRPFVTSLIPVVGDFAAAHQPVITVLSEGTQLGVQAVVSHDRRFVRLTLVPVFSQIGDVEEFTFSGSTSTDTGSNVVDANGDPTGERDNTTTTRSGTTIQLPSFSQTSVSTTVSVPDGGTVLLGGIKRLSEGRIERGVPGLSKLPYVSRLFKNVGIGRDTQSLMLLVTPRIIIQEEEEEKLGIEVNP